MTRQLIVGFIVAVAAAGIVACSSGPESTPAQPTSVSTTATPATDGTVDGFLGVWNPDTGEGTPLEFDGPENTSDRIIPDGVCRFVEFKVDRDADSRRVKVVFAALCANARIRGVGAGQLSEGVLHWRAQGGIALSSGQRCQFTFVEGNRAVRVPQGLKVHYSGTVCDVAVSGTQIVRKKR